MNQLKKVNDIKTTDTSVLVKKTQKFNRLTSETFKAKLKQANQANRIDAAGFV